MIAPIHEHGIRNAEHRADQRVQGDLLFRNCSKIAAQEFSDDQHIDSALVIEQENGWAM